MSSFALMTAAFASAGLGLAAALWALACVRQVQQRFALQTQKAEQELAIIKHGAIGMGSRIVSLEKKLQSVSLTQAAALDPEAALYTQAMQLFDSGAEVNDVVASCGISSSEASLMALVRQKAQPRRTEAEA